MFRKTVQQDAVALLRKAGLPSVAPRVARILERSTNLLFAADKADLRDSTLYPAGTKKRLRLYGTATPKDLVNHNKRPDSTSLRFIRQ